MTASPLQVVCEVGGEKLAAMLLDAKASVNAARSSDGFAPLHTACQFRREKVAKFLLNQNLQPLCLLLLPFLAHVWHIV